MQIELLIAPDKKIKHEDDTKILSFYTGNVQKNMQAASKRRFSSGQLMNTDHMVVSHFDAKINTVVCTLGT